MQSYFEGTAIEFDFFPLQFFMAIVCGLIIAVLLYGNSRIVYGFALAAVAGALISNIALPVWSNWLDINPKLSGIFGSILGYGIAVVIMRIIGLQSSLSLVICKRLLAIVCAGVVFFLTDWALFSRFPANAVAAIGLAATALAYLYKFPISNRDPRGGEDKLE